MSTSRNDERRPRLGAPLDASPSHRLTVAPILRPDVDDGNHNPVDLLTLTPRERECYDVGRTFGYIEGHEAGARWADDRAAAIHRRALAIVHAMARFPERDAEADRAAAARRDARWTA